jgi:predicted nucleic acid-binding protein
LIDTNIMADFTRGNSKAADYLDSLNDACLLSAITALELIGGARSQRSRRPTMSPGGRII